VGFSKLTVRDVPLEHKVVLVRADYNVPLSSDGKISDDLRIKASLPTIQYLLEQKCTVVIMSHLGRPEGKQKKFSLRPVGKHLAKLLDHPVAFVTDCIGDKVVQAVKKAQPGSVILLENLRFYTEEEANDADFARSLARDTQARYFVQDGFGVVHRAHASTAAITNYVPSVAGLLLEKEVSTITHAMKAPERPFVAVLGGAKISDKIGVIEKFVKVADKIVVGGAMANTFLAFRGLNMGASVMEANQTEVISRIYDAVRKKIGDKNVDDFLILPRDVAVATTLDKDAVRKVVPVGEIATDEKALDAGDFAISVIAQAVADARTVIWNGTLGYAEIPAFAHGSARLALALATQPQTLSIIGGGDTADFVLKWDGHDGASFGHVSTGGGASLELMAGTPLPGVECLLTTPRSATLNNKHKR
jgi:phosphoglycerate kinase